MPQEHQGRRAKGNGDSGSGNDIIIKHSLARKLEKSSSQESSINKAASWTRRFCDTNEPHHIATSKDVHKTIGALSAKDRNWAEIDATFIHDLDESWISQDLVTRLGLKLQYHSENHKEYGHWNGCTVTFIGTVELQWSEKGDKGYRKSQFENCKVVSSKSNESFTVFLKSSLLPGGARHSLMATPILTANFAPSLPPDPLSIPFQSPVSPVLRQVGAFDAFPTESKEEDAKTADEWICRLKKSVHSRIEEGDRQKVKIAVLDTGIDTKHPFIKGAISAGRIAKTYRSFVTGDSSIEDSAGHGTHVTSLILDVAPNSEVHVVRIAQKMEIPYTHCIANAIRWAISLEVDIINLSLGLEKEDNSIQDAILKAVCRNIIIFSAASNGGGNNCVTYPARKDEVICVYATDGMGTAFTGNPTTLKTSSYDFAALGIAVNSSWPKSVPIPQSERLNTTGSSKRRMTGTSFATPIAAGVAACIIDFAYMIGLPEVKLLKARQGMQKVMKGLMVEGKRSELDYLCPWAMFEGKSDEKIMHLMSYFLDH